ncbi:major facilitator superfamily protein [Sarocladium implicatum]|nr:major facilitator superfamily protein [Sarocladium implicatum]
MPALTDNTDDEERSHGSPPPSPPPSSSSSSPGPVTWSSLPHKDQLLLLFLGRFADFLQLASLQAYVFYQLRDMSPSLSDAEISGQAGILQGCFTGAQVATAFLWGKAADARWCGRKNVLIVGLAGTAVSCVGYGFATTFFWAAFWRVVGGGVNVTVGIIRTMVSEVTKERRYQSRAFLILPMSFNAAGILGPIMGGIMANPSKTMPSLFGAEALFGYQWLRDYPYALPNLVNALSLMLCTVTIWLFLRETSRNRQGHFDYGLQTGNRIKQLIWGSKVIRNQAGWTSLPQDMPLEEQKEVEPSSSSDPAVKGILPLRRIWTRNVLFTLAATAFYDFQLGAFTNIWSLFLSTPRYVPEEQTKTAKRGLPLLFTGGLGMPASTVGLATAILGVLGMFLQICLYPKVHARLGTLRSYQLFFPIFAVCYFLAPYISILPSTSPAPQPMSGPAIWLGITFILLLQTTARTVIMPGSIILLNNSSPHPSVLGTIHGLGQSVSAAFRTVGPVVGGRWYGYGLDIGMVAWGWWGTAFVAVLGSLTALGMYEGNGHEVLLPGEQVGA